MTAETERLGGEKPAPGGLPSTEPVPKTDRRRTALLAGNFLSRTIGIRTYSEDLSDQLTSSGWTVIATSSKRRRISRLLDAMWTVWARRNEYVLAQVDVYSGPAFFFAEAVCWTLRRAGKPYVLTLHGGGLPDFARRSSARVRRLLRSAAAVTAPSRYLPVEMGWLGTNLLPLPNGLDLARYPYRPRNRLKPHLVWLRAFHRIYNPSLAPRVVALLAEDYPGIRLTMVGPDKKDGSLQATRRIAEDLKIADRLFLTGPIPKTRVSDFLDQADVFLNTSGIDNAPVSLLEAMACGLCVVSTDVGGIPYLLESGRDALLVPADRPEEMAAAVRRVLTDPRLAEQLSRNARSKAESFDWREVSEQWEALFSRVSAEAPATHPR